MLYPTVSRQITQILTGIVQVALGIILTLVKDHVLIAIQVGTPFWTGILVSPSGGGCGVCA
ncbi:membrane-spanning 4-domains subfamily A member 15-like [Chelydra serpentina]|uniref:Membrane-spanning 4-domains subfamily A member 15-like n=1 Tax=Chelydra serpentina TaxID=8475 RepID=A0A8T1RWN4_CHESE|nr:membrane-spanning 4-domains subfamily A member 15-like [Chelydra serpentina]